MGQPPLHYFPVPERDKLPPSVMVSGSPLGWFLFLRHLELDDEVPSYGVDWDGWVGYHYPRQEVTSQELLKRGKVAWGRSVEPSRRRQEDSHTHSHRDDKPNSVT